MRSYDPSKPALALVSQHGMPTASKTRLEVVRDLYPDVIHQPVPVTYTGDVTAALILLFTVDNAQPEGGRGQQPLKLATFLSALLPNNVVESIQARMENRDGLRTLWDEGTVSFNRFVRLVDDPDEGTLRRAYDHGVAVFPHSGYKGPDMIVPVFLPSKDEMSYILVRGAGWRQNAIIEDFKDAEKGSLKYDALSLSGPETGYDDDEAEPVPHIGIIFSLRGEEGHAAAKVIYPEPATSQGPAAAGPYSFDDLERVVVAAVGMDFSIYPGLLHPKDTASDPVNSIETLDFLREFLCHADLDKMSDYERRLMCPLG